MATKAGKTKKVPAKSERHATNWAKLKTLWEQGASYELMAKATDPHFNPKNSDPCKPTRAKICRARKQGVRIDGKLVRFGARGKVKDGAKKAKAKETPTKAKAAKPKAKPQNGIKPKASSKTATKPKGKKSETPSTVSTPEPVIVT
jgi:hypothetical protein